MSYKYRYDYTVEQMQQHLDDWGVPYLKVGDRVRQTVSALYCNDVQEFLDDLHALNISPKAAILSTYCETDDYGDYKVDVYVEHYVPATIKQSSDDICDKFDEHMERQAEMKSMAQQYGYVLTKKG